MTRIAFANVDNSALAKVFAGLVEDPPWPWLENASGVVAWQNDVDALSFAKDEFKALFGSTPNLIDRVLARSFAATVARQRALDPGISELVREAIPSTSGVE